MSKMIPFTTRHEGTLDACAQTLAEHTTLFEKINARFDDVNGDLRHTKVMIEVLDSKLDMILEVFEHNGERLKKQENRTPRVDHLETRVDMIESHLKKDA